jgi:malonyl-CoA/methylmalonyl-CoA synthetase
MSNLYSAIQASLARFAQKPLFQVEGASFTGQQVEAAVQRFAHALVAQGLQPGDRLAVQVEKSIDNVFLYLACLRVGGVYLPLNTAYRPAEVSYFLGDARPRIFIAALENAADLRATASAAGVQVFHTLGVRNDGSFAALAATQPMQSAPLVERAPDDLAVICYTSGTTGRSKGAMITHDNLLSNARTLVDLWGFTDQDVLLHALPLYHIHGLFVALHTALLSGTTTLLHAKFDAKAALAALSGATAMMGVPTFYTRLLGEAALNADSVRNIRLFVSGSAPLLTDTFNSFEQRTGHRILERYGMTETGMIASNPFRGERRGGTVGLPLPKVEVRITDEQGASLPAGSVGSVEVRGPNVFKGYWQQPEKTKAEIRTNGFFITGDVGSLSADGYLQLIGRAKDLIISGGLNVYPKEIEDAIDALEGVTESAVFAIPHPDFGEAVAAAVTLTADSKQSAESIIAALRPILAGFKTPKRIYILKELPRNAMSKVQKALLREQYKNAFAAGVRDT